MYIVHHNTVSLAARSINRYVSMYVCKQDDDDKSINQWFIRLCSWIVHKKYRSDSNVNHFVNVTMLLYTLHSANYF